MASTAEPQSAAKQAHAGTAELGTKFLLFKKALAYARSLKLTTQNEWRAWRKSGARPACIPSNPEMIYKHEGWQGYRHWLCTAERGTKFLPFEEALLYARSLMLNSNQEWRAWRKSDARPACIPAGPESIYKHHGWQGYGHWLGTGALAHKDRQFLPFKKALLHVRSLKLKGVKEWRAWRKSDARPANIPSNPEATYKHDGWQGYGHWLGAGAVAHTDQKFLPFAMRLSAQTDLDVASRHKSDHFNSSPSSHGDHSASATPCVASNWTPVVSLPATLTARAPSTARSIGQDRGQQHPVRRPCHLPPHGAAANPTVKPLPLPAALGAAEPSAKPLPLPAVYFEHHG